MTLDDDDVYQCQVIKSASESLRSKEVNVTVWKPPEAPFIEEAPILNVKENRDVTLTCISRGGRPKPKVSRILKIYNFGVLSAFLYICKWHLCCPWGYLSCYT